MKILIQARFALLALAGISSNASGATAEAEVFHPPQTPVTAALPRAAVQVPVGLSIELPAPQLPRAAAAAPRSIGPRQVGLGRELPAELGKVLDTQALHWVSDGSGGRLALVTIRSGTALGVRAGIQVFKLPDTVGLRFYPADKPAAPGYRVSGAQINASLARDKAVRESDDPAAAIYWTPVVEGERLAMEIHLPAGVGPKDLEIAISQLSHLYQSAIGSPPDQSLGVRDAQSCSIDYTCRIHVWGDAGPAVARMLYTVNGNSFLCTGTLVTDLDPANQIPYFLTAQHCISSQAVASTLQTYWFFRSDVCDGLPSQNMQVRSGGATLLVDITETDTTLMRLHATPPEGAVLAGWDTTPVAASTPVGGIAHPAGDLKKVSVGVIRGPGTCYTPPDPDDNEIFCSPADRGNYLLSRYSHGMDEGGSSGSGLLLRNSHKLVGTLTGGNASCDNYGGEVYYGRFDVAYEHGLKRWLGANGGCDAEPGSWAFCSNPACGPCGEGEGDCDFDHECNDGLVCTDDVGADYGFTLTTDVCMKSATAPTPQACQRDLGDWDYCADPNCGPCAGTEGDCDSNSECRSGLVCLDDQGALHGFPPTVDVCAQRPSGDCTLSNGDWNFCSDLFCGPCAVGKGDCDSDADCNAGLVCAANVGAKYGLPASMDVCELPGATACTKSVGAWDYCADPACGPCTSGQGDCDGNAQCAAGLQCSFNSGEQHGLPANMDVCTKP